MLARCRSTFLHFASRPEHRLTTPPSSNDNRLPAGQTYADPRLMNWSVNLRRWRWGKLAVPVLLALSLLAMISIRAVREPILRVAGALLVVDEAIAPVDLIVLSLDSGGAGVLEAADLVKSGIATRVAVFPDPPTADDIEFIRRGLPYEDGSARQIRQLASLGIMDVIQISPVNGTEAEGQVLPSWCDEQHFRSIVVVATSDHTRRLRRVLDRAMKGHPTHVIVRSARFSNFDPNRWWETRSGVRTAIVEFQKLLLDVALHPL